MTGPVALVVGASRGIGAAVADRLAADGFGLLLVGRTESDLADVAMRSAAAEVVVADVSTTQGTATVVAAAVRRPPAVVVAVARSRVPWKPVSRLQAGEVGRAVDHHLDHLIALARVVLPAQRAAGFGRWIFISSTVALMGGAGQAVYTAHKLAMEGFSRTLALEEGRNGITANVVAPGFVDTEATRAAYPQDMFAALSAMNTVGRAGTPEEVAHVVSALADRRAGFVTGSTVVAGGGVELAWPVGLAARSPATAAQFASGTGRP